MSIKFRVFKFLQRAMLGYETGSITFSQAGEDFIIRNFFYGRLSTGEAGFFVDIGAFHPYQDSNTYYLYRAGWTGINIDARPGSMQLFDKLRPRDINLEIGIADRTGITTYYDFGVSSGLNTMSSDYITRLGTDSRIKKTIEIETKSMAQVLYDHVPEGTAIDFLNIDIEDMEERALASNDWSTFRPKLIACEIYGFSMREIRNAEVSKLLNRNGYELYARVNLAMPKVNTVFFFDSQLTFNED